MLDHSPSKSQIESVASHTTIGSKVDDQGSIIGAELTRPCPATGANRRPVVSMHFQEVATILRVDVQHSHFPVFLEIQIRIAFYYMELLLG